MVRQFIGVRIVLFLVVIALIRPFSRGSDESFRNHYLLTPSNTVLTISLILVFLGLFLAIWARVYLGRNWGMPMTQKVDPELVTSGPYKYIRHPIYSGILLAAIGSVLGSGEYWLLFIIFAGPYFIYSATVEEKLMAKQFPAVYPSYKSKTKMLIPFVF